MKKSLVYLATALLLLNTALAATLFDGGVQTEDTFAKLHVAPAIAQAPPGHYFEQIIEITNKQESKFDSDIGFLFGEQLKDIQILRETKYNREIPVYSDRDKEVYHSIAENKTSPEGCLEFNETHYKCTEKESFIERYDSVADYRWESLDRPTLKINADKFRYNLKSESLPSGTQKYLIKYKADAPEGEWFLAIDTALGELLLDPWFNTTCKKKRNISFSDIVGTQTINLTIQGDSLFNYALNHNESNFTFSDTSETSKLNFLIDYINNSGNSDQEIQFFVNISNNESVFMYYDCGFNSPQEDRTTGAASPVMLAYYTFEDGMQGFSAVSGGICGLENTTAALDHGGRRDKQVLALTYSTTDAQACQSPTTALGSFREYANFEVLWRRRGNNNDYQILETRNSSNSQNVRCFLENDANGADFGCNVGGSMSQVVDLTPTQSDTFQRYRLYANYSQTDPSLFWDVNGTSANVLSNGFDQNNPGLAILYIKNRPSDIDEIKIWAQNNATIITFGDETEINASENAANESEGRTAIVQGIDGALTGYTLYTDHVVHVRLSNGSQFVGSFDKAVEKENQFWVFNYVTSGESFTNMPEIADVFYVWENETLLSGDIIKQVGDYINITKE